MCDMHSSTECEYCKFILRIMNSIGYLLNCDLFRVSQSVLFPRGWLSFIVYRWPSTYELSGYLYFQTNQGTSLLFVLPAARVHDLIIIQMA